MPSEETVRSGIKDKLCDREYIFRLELQGLRLLEQQTGKSIQELTNAALDGKLFFDDVVAILWASLIDEDGKGPTTDEISEMVWKDGIINAGPIARNVMFLQAVGAQKLEQISEIMGQEVGTTKTNTANKKKSRKSLTGPE